MDVERTATSNAVNLVKDPLGEKCQKLFQDFLNELVDQFLKIQKKPLET